MSSWAWLRRRLASWRAWWLSIRLRERLWRLLVLALYRCGRQADALAAYRRARAVLAGELGIEPGPELRALERAVLRQQVPAAAPRRAQHNLPARLTSFVGREQELAALEEMVAEARLVTVTGAGGAGKTRLAVEFAAAAAERFDDGAWLAGLAGITDPGLVPGAGDGGAGGAADQRDAGARGAAVPAALGGAAAGAG